jgi:MacB-like periplasmic core domain
MRFEFFIAARYLRAKRRQAVVGVITAISVIGVAAGVASLIIAMAITNGMRRDLQERLVGSTSHVDLMRVAGDGIRDWRPLLERLRKVPHVVAAAPGLYGQVLISHGARSGGGLIKGVIPADEKTVGDLLQSVREGSGAALEPAASLAVASSVHPTLLHPSEQKRSPGTAFRDEAAKDGAPGGCGLMVGYFFMVCQRPRGAPVGSMMMLNQPMLGTSWVSLATWAPRDWALAVEALTSSTRT